MGCLESVRKLYQMDSHVRNIVYTHQLDAANTSIVVYRVHLKEHTTKYKKSQEYLILF